VSIVIACQVDAQELAKIKSDQTGSFYNMIPPPLLHSFCYKPRIP